LAAADAKDLRKSLPLFLSTPYTLGMDARQIAMIHSLGLMITCRDHEDQEPFEMPREKFGTLYQAFYRQTLTNLPPPEH
jgi:hypothetical protein